VANSFLLRKPPEREGEAPAEPFRAQRRGSAGASPSHDGFLQQQPIRSCCGFAMRSAGILPASVLCRLEACATRAVYANRLSATRANSQWGLAAATASGNAFGKDRRSCLTPPSNRWRIGSLRRRSWPIGYSGEQARQSRLRPFRTLPEQSGEGGSCHLDVIPITPNWRTARAAPGGELNASAGDARSRSARCCRAAYGPLAIGVSKLGRAVSALSALWPSKSGDAGTCHLDVIPITLNW